MTRMRQWIVTALLAMLSCHSNLPPGPDWGVEYVFKVHPPAQDEQAQGGVPRGVKRIERRLSLAGFPYAQVIPKGDDMKIRIPGVDASNVLVAARAIAAGGMLRIYQVADAKAQTVYQQTRVVPTGHRVIENRVSAPSSGGVEVDPWSAPVLLLKNEVIFKETEILDAWPEPDREGTLWRTVFELSKEAAQRLDAAVAEVARMRPPGVLAIVIDEQLFRTFTSKGPIHREAHITGLASEGEARNLASLFLRGGYNPVWKHSDVFGTELKAPYTMRYYGTPKSSEPKPGR